MTPPDKVLVAEESGGLVIVPSLITETVDGETLTTYRASLDPENLAEIGGLADADRLMVSIGGIPKTIAKTDLQTTLAVPTALSQSGWDGAKGVTDALAGLTGLIVGDGAGNFAATPDHHANWDASYSERSTWDGVAVGNAATARATLGLRVGTDIQAFNSNLTLWGVLTPFVATPADKDLLAFDTATGKWKNQTAAQVGMTLSETDPVFLASAAAGITSTQIAHWQSAYGWGNHDGLYLTPDEFAAACAAGTTEPLWLASVAHSITGDDITAWNAQGALPTTLGALTGLLTSNGAGVFGATDPATFLNASFKWQWDGGSTNLNAATGRASLGLDNVTNHAQYYPSGPNVAIADGGTGADSAQSAFDALSGMTALGDLVYGGVLGARSILAGNTVAAKKFLGQTGTGSVSAAPVWDYVSKTDVGLSAVENTALSIWAGSANITTLGTVTTGAIADAAISSAATWNGKQAGSSALTSLAGLTWASGSPLVKMTAAGTFGLDTNSYALSSHTHDYSGTFLGLHAKADDADKLDGIDSTGFALSGHNHSGVYQPAGSYLTSLAGAVLTDQTTPQTIGLTGARLAKLWATDITVTNAITGSITGSASTVTGFSPTSGKTLTLSNSITLTATDGSTLAIGTGGTLGSAAYTATTAYDASGAATTAVSNHAALITGIHGLVITTGKTLTLSNSLTFSGTDASTLNVGTGGTLGTAAYTAATAYEASGAIATHAALTTAHGLNAGGVRNYLAGGAAGPSWAALNQAAVAGLTTADSPTHAGLIIGSASAGGNITANATLGAECAPALTTGNWTMGTGWTSPPVGSLAKIGDGTDVTTQTGGDSITVGTTYKVVVTVATISGSTALIQLGGNSGITLSAATTYTGYITALTTAKLCIYPTATALRINVSSVSIKALADNTGDATISGNFVAQSPITVYGSASIGGNIMPDYHGIRSIGSAANSWNELYSRYITSSILCSVTGLTVSGAQTNGTESAGANLTVNATLGAECAPAITSTDYTVGAGWAAVSGGTLSKTGDGTGTAAWSSGGTAIVAYTNYKVVIVVDSISGSTSAVSLGGQSANILISSSGTKTFYITAATTGKLILTPSATGLRMVVSSISIKAYTKGTGDVGLSGDLTVKGANTTYGPTTLYGPLTGNIMTMDGWIPATNKSIGIGVGPNMVYGQIYSFAYAYPDADGVTKSTTAVRNYNYVSRVGAADTAGFSIGVYNYTLLRSDGGYNATGSQYGMLIEMDMHDQCTGTYAALKALSVRPASILTNAYVTDNYAIYIPSFAPAHATNNWAIYSAGTAKTYFGGVMTVHGLLTCDASLAVTGGITATTTIAATGAVSGSNLPELCAFTGPATTSKTYTLPNASCAILTDNSTLTMVQGGTGANLTAGNGGLVYSGASALAIGAAGTAGQIAVSAGASAPVWKTRVAFSDVATHTHSDAGVTDIVSTTLPASLLANTGDSITIDAAGNFASSSSGQFVFLFSGQYIYNVVIGTSAGQITTGDWALTAIISRASQTSLKCTLTMRGSFVNGNGSATVYVPLTLTGSGFDETQIVKTTGSAGPIITQNVWRGLVN